MLGAISMTLIRLLIERKNLLQWTTAANTARSFRSKAQYEIWGEMSASLVFAILLGAAVAIFNPNALWVALPFVIAWLVAPQVAYVISQPVTHVTAPLSETQRRQVRRLARRTWAFFEQFAGPDDHWLPPDHYQESPREMWHTIPRRPISGCSLCPHCRRMILVTWDWLNCPSVCAQLLKTWISWNITADIC